MNADEHRKLVVIGLDGATFAVIDPLIKAGKLPNMARLVSEGVSGDLESTMPPVTGPAWASFMTGKSPGAHGLFDFVKPVANQSARQIVNYNHIRSKTLWSILSEKGKKLGIVNVPLTYPPPKVRGFLISGMLTPSTQSEYTHPPSLSKELERRFGRYVLDIWWQHYGPKRIKQFLKDLMDCTHKRERIALDLMESREWDFFMTVFIGMDRIQHALWDVLSPEGSYELSGANQEVRELIIEYYQLVDDIVGKMVQAIEGKGNVIIISDHGFGPLKGKLYINKWLQDVGLLSFDATKASRFCLKTKLAPLYRAALRKADVFNLRKRMIVSKEGETGGVYRFLECVDWARTRAYAPSNTEPGIYVNLTGREPHGIVKPGPEWEKTRDLIIEKLNDLRHPSTKERMVSRIYRKESIYSGPYASDAADIIFILKEGEYVPDVHPANCLIEEASWRTGTGTHRMEGIFIGYGKDIREEVRVTNARIIDIAPTILHLMNVPIPEDMDGRVMVEIFLDDFLNNNAPEYVSPSDGLDTDTVINEDYSAGDSEHLKEQLKGLGYM